MKKKKKKVCEHCHYAIDLVTLSRPCYFCATQVHRCYMTFVMASEYQDCHMILAADPPRLVVCYDCLEGEL